MVILTNASTELWVEKTLPEIWAALQSRHGSGCDFHNPPSSQIVVQRREFQF